MLLNEQCFVYNPNQYLIVTLDRRTVGQIEEASHAKPLMGLSLVRGGSHGAFCGTIQ
jgi:hypothetical protein